jgi:prepilin-type N-terminal cleavage/methylation domain-containing protein
VTCVRGTAVAYSSVGITDVERKMATHTEIRNDMQRRLPCRARDARTPITGGQTAKPVRAGGFTLIELLVAMMLFAVMVGTALAAFPRRPYAVWSAQAVLVSELRHARNDALTKGTHYRLIVGDASSWATYRLTFAGGVWVPVGAPVRSGTLPSGIEFISGVGKTFEFTTRGLMVTPDAATTVTIEDIDSSTARGVVIYPSGQVAPA